MQNGYKEKNSQGNFTTFDRKSQETEDHLNENNQQFFVKRIGRTNFKVNVFFSETEKETLEDKILRIIRRETLENGSECGIINKSWFCSQLDFAAMPNRRLVLLGKTPLLCTANEPFSLKGVQI